MQEGCQNSHTLK